MPPFRKAANAGLSATLTGLGTVRRPNSRGQLKLAGLRAPVEVFRDRWGVPHIYAGSTLDLLFAQGFVHAQDRLWQMDFQRRLVAGRLGEVLGAAGARLDRNTRILGMYRVAEAEVGLLQPDVRAELEAYVEGVNACIARQPLPVEFTLLRYHPEPWKLADSLCWGKMMAWGLSVNWETELLRARLVEVLGPDRAAELEPLLPSTVIMGIPTPGAAAEPAHPAESFPEGPFEPAVDSPGDLPSTGGTPGSNNWVISGARTATGHPILANDMHLPIAAPAIWFENHLVCTAADAPLDVAGVSFAGIPYVVAGHNDRVAWGFTNGFPDVQDLFVEHLRRGPQGVEYEHRGAWHPAEVRREEIRVKGGPAIVQEVIVTAHGPIINSLASGLASSVESDGVPEKPLALRWTALDPQPMVQALRSMNRARSCADFRDAARGWIAPTQNMVYADVDNNIGYTHAGRVPVRRKGDGRVPVPGWTGEYDWDGWIPFDALPHLENPAAGFIVTANNRVVDQTTYPYFLGREYAMGDRAARITELIRLDQKITVSGVRAIQLDQEASSLKRLAECLAALEVAEPELRDLVTLVRAWDGLLSAESPAAAVVEIFGRLVQTVVMEVRLSSAEDDPDDIPLLDRVRGRGPTPGLQETSFFYHHLWEWLYSVLDDPSSHWWDLGHGETRDDVLRLALRRTYDYLVPRLGEPESGYRNWGWGRLHLVTFGHIAGQIPALAGHFNRGPYPVGGDENTVFATGGRVTVEGSTSVVGPPFRFIADLSDLSRCYGLLAPGNSGRPDSPHYDDQIEAWFKGKYHPMLYRREDVERGARQKVLLTPR